MFGEIDDSFDFVNMCTNNSLLPSYNVSIRARVKNRAGHQFTGPWSEGLAVEPNCSEFMQLGLLIAIIIVSVSVAGVLMGLLVYILRYWRKKKDFFEKLGQELDERVITVTKTESRHENKHYPVTKFDRKIERKNDDFSTDDNRDLMQVIHLSLPH